MDTESTSERPAAALDSPPGGGELRGSVLAVLEALLGDFSERKAVLAIVGKLVADNAQLARRLARLSGFKKSEKRSEERRGGKEC